MFIVIGIVGLLLLVLALLFDDVLDGVLPETDWLSTTAVATMATAFGFGSQLLYSRFDLPALPSAIGGGVFGLSLGLVAVRWSRSLSSMATDATPSASDLLGCQGRIITPVPAGAAGEALVRLAGQQVKLSAVASGRAAAEPLAGGVEIVVVGVLSPTRVEVEPADSFWA